MVSMVSPRQAENSDDLMLVDSPSLRERLSESRFSDRPLLTARPSFGRRAARAFIRFVIACGVGVAGTLAWQSYGEAAKQTIAAWGTQQGWSMAWLSNGEATKPNSTVRPERAGAAPAAQAAPDTAPGPSAAASELQQVKTMTLGLAATLTTMRERIEQLAAGQERTANDVAKLQTAEQEIQHKISALPARPAAAAPGRPTTTVPPRAPSPQPPR